jgi:hypothetical protein
MILRIDKPDLLVGLTLEKAKEYIEEHGYEALLIHQDGFTRMTPQGGYDPLRVKLHVVKGIVTKAVIG